MKTKALFLAAAISLSSLCLTGCSDPGAVLDDNVAMPNKVWAYNNKVAFDIKIADAAVNYNVYLNLRVTGNYRYSNIFVLISDPANKGRVTRWEFKLAEPDGRWLGKGSGNLYSYQMPFRKNYHFPAAGTYRIQIEQNMRDNPLHEVSDVGLRVEKAK